MTDVGQRVILTTMFVDIVSSSSFFESYDDEEVDGIFQDFLSRISVIIEGHHGSVNQLLGDGVMAIFGLNGETERHDLLACRAAEDIQNLNNGISVRIGIDMGEVVLSQQSSGNLAFRVVGKSVHRAAKMEKAAKPSMTLVSGTIVESLKDFAQFSPFMIPGPSDDEELQAFQLKSTVRSTIQNNEERLHFVGRNDQFAELQKMARQIRSGRSRVAVLVAEPGLGKSRLIEEFARTFDQKDICFIKLYFSPAGHARDMADKIIFKQLMTVLERAAAAKAKFLAQVEHPLFRAAIAYLHGEAGDEALGHYDFRALKSACYAVLEKMIAVLTAELPVILLVEDLHWAADDFNAAFFSLIANLRGVALGAIISTRDVGGSYFDLSFVSIMRLMPLTDEAQDEILRRSLGVSQTLAALKAELKSVSGGNPLYLRELLYVLQQNGSLSGDFGAFVCVEESSQINLPLSLQNLFEQRIRSLSLTAQRLARQAAIVGESFDLEILSFVAGQPLSIHSSGFSELLHLGFFIPSEAFPIMRYRFSHALLRESIYRGILKREKETYHTSLYHYLREGRLQGDYDAYLYDAAQHAYQGGLIWEALSHNYVAGRRALQRTQGSAAAEYFENALKILEKLPRRHSLNEKCHLHLAIAYSIQSKHEQARNHLAASKNYSPSIRRKDHARHRVASMEVFDFWIKGSLSEGVKRGRALLQVIDLHEDPYNFITISARVAGMLLDSGLHRESNEILAPLFQTVGDGNAHAFYGLLCAAPVMIHGLAAQNFSEIGDFMAARVHSHKALALLDDNPNVFTKIYGLTSIGSASMREKKYDEAVRIFTRANSLSATIKTSLLYPFVAAHLGFCLIQAGSADEGLGLLNESWSIANQQTAYGRQALYLHLMAEAKFKLSMFHEAKDNALQGVTIGRQYGEASHVAWCHYILAQISFRQGDMVQGNEYLVEAMSTAKVLHLDPLRSECDALMQRHRLFSRARF